MADHHAWLLDAGNAALQRADWSAAEGSFRAALDAGENGEAEFGLGIARWWSGDTNDALRCWERAYTAFRGEGRPEQAVLAAVYLCLAYQMSFGIDAAARGWLERADATVLEFGLPDMRGWVLLCRAYVANDAHNPAEAETHARGALAIAQAAGDTDLGLCATSELGAALLGRGHVDEGGALLDQAMAGALAGETDLDGMVLISCRTIASCARTADIKRAAQWIRAADDFNERHGSTHLFLTCRTHHGRILFAVGDWTRADQELRAAVTMAAGAEPVLHADALACLAELRLAQGSTEEAARILSGYEHHAVTLQAWARLQLASGAPAAAAAAIRRRLRDLDGDCLDRFALIELLTEAELEGGSALDLTTLRTGDCEPSSTLTSAYWERALGRATVASGDRGLGVRCLESALLAFGDLGMPFECARTRLLIARAVAAGEGETAVAEARAAFAVFERLGAVREADAAAVLLRSLGVKVARTGPRGVGVLTKRELEILTLLGEGLSNRGIAERMFISRKTAEHHVASVLRKLGLERRSEATALAVRYLNAQSTPK